MKLFRARYLLPIATPPLEDGALLIEGRRIVASGPFAELRQASAELVDFGDAILLPPLVNAHTHLELTHFPQWAAGAGETETPSTFVDWILQVIRVKRRRNPDDFGPSLAAGIAESLRAGTGAVGDILSCFPAHEIYRGFPLRGRFFLEVLGRDPEANRRLLQSALNVAEEGKIGALEPGLSPHSPYSLSADYLEEVFSAARRHDLPATTHLAESSAEIEFLAESRGDFACRLFPFVGWGNMVPPPAGRSPVRFLSECGGIHPRNLLVHCVQLGQADINELVSAGAAVVLCPRSNARLGVGRAPIALFLEAGIPLAMGTDSRASCDSLSVWDEIAFARNIFAGEAAPAHLLEMATRGGARALGLAGEMGTLEPGAGAHFQVLTPDDPPPYAQIQEFLCSPGRTGEVSSLYLDGVDVLQKG